MPGHKVFLQDGGEIREGLTCAYCKLVLKDPVQTSETGYRLCRECFEEATRNPSHAVDFQLDPNNEIWPDFAVKKEIGNLIVKCENCTIGCDWKGLFKQLMQHSQECQYVTVECGNPGCGQRVLLAKIKVHLKEECPRRHVSCKDCGKKMYFIELQDHTGKCPNGPRKCQNCDKIIPAYKLADHMIHKCKHVRCVCKNDEETYEVDSTKFYDHLQDASKLADHLGPMICEFTKMSKAFKEMTVSYQQATERIDILEKHHQGDTQRIEMLESGHQEDAKRIEMLEKKNNELESKNQILENKSNFVVQMYDRCLDIVNQLQHTVQCFENNMEEFKKRFRDMEKRSNKDHFEAVACLQDMNIAAVRPSGDKMVSHEKPSEFMKQVEEKVLEVEGTLNVLSVHHSELELQLQASLASTHNGAFLWRISEVRRRIRDAKMDRITSIYSPPFYTGRNGYKMCITAYLNGDGSGEGTHLSIFFVLMKGEYDPLLQWPFESKVSLILVDQGHKEHLVQTFKPNVQSSSFQRPKTDINVASGCPEFANLSILDNTSYVKDDVMYIKAIVDTSKIFHP